MLSITSDYAADTGCPEPYLRAIADHGFTHIHWCHHWNTDFLYADCEIEQIDKWMKEYGLRLTDLHASDGKEKKWYSPREYERQAGVELIQNRIAMTARLGADVIIMHQGAPPPEEQGAARYWEQLFRSLDDLEPCARQHGVRIAIENGVFANIRRVFASYPADYVGLCYDCGHGNISKDGLDETDALKERLLSLHLHDNDGAGDQHKPIFSGTVDWPRLAKIIATSGYRKWVSMECNKHQAGLPDEDAFLAHAYETGTRFAAMVEAAG